LVGLVVIGLGLGLFVAFGSHQKTQALLPSANGFDRKEKATAAENMIRDFFEAKGARVIEISLIRESNRKMKGYVILGSAQLQSQRHCEVELDSDMENMLMTCRGGG